ncbi:MAG: hypothetical protein UR66_C0001G0060 [Candidatus Moranbacteria bacterium GW2011_GWE1_35_17]|nr:MAG: hypothetical protein UR66_C0001G0060 [Candidatus Moranbacteria bacterium GW2011_GWE1_35_17]KKP73490.1 MAG: hypothetical protein UR65_C0003G0014 [Candidatus Moranbacteria bacterium GW2011_GWE2_35_164]KKP83405.1 MAG: hypothetical protein UR82_C0021G0035 [Candidatus Moranbacteria bacterium GW2011_GWF1_35_5]KKP85222.1 MAG: hypothetical protein UR83_C0003G0057 [Candidatus Moranbacteria bacterium GW2011_GWF2_35_54]
MAERNKPNENASENEHPCDIEIRALQESARSIINIEEVFWRRSALANEEFWDYVQRIRALQKKRRQEDE